MPYFFIEVQYQHLVYYFVLYHLPKTDGRLTKRMLLLTRSVSGVTLKLLVGDVVNVVDEVLITLEIAGSTPAPTILKLLYLKTSKSFFFIVVNKFTFLSSENRWTRW